ncbi:Increased rDNA silencing protein [Clarireedia jacksonii]
MTAESNPSDTNGNANSSGTISTTRRSVQQPLRAQNAALTGASFAFSNKPPVKPKPIVNTYSGSNGALAAATKVGGRSLSPAKSSTLEQHMRSQRTGESSTTDASEGWGVQRGSPQFNQRLNGLLQPSRNTADPAKSPAFMAANLAASRSVSNSPNHTGQRLPSPARRLSYASSIDSHDRRPDVSSIPPTSSLVGMFEQNATPSQKKVVKRPVSPRLRPVSSATTLAPSPHLLPSPKKSTKPPVQPPRRASLEGLRSETMKASVSKPTPPAPRPVSSYNAPSESTKDAPNPPIKPPRPALVESTEDKTIRPPPKPAAPAPKSTSSIASPKAIEQNSKPPVQPPRRTSTTTKPPPPKSPKPKTILPSKPTSTPSAHDTNDSDASSNDSFVSASSQRRLSWRAELSRQPPRPLPSLSTSPTPSTPSPTPSSPPRSPHPASPPPQKTLLNPRSPSHPPSQPPHPSLPPPPPPQSLPLHLPQPVPLPPPPQNHHAPAPQILPRP